MRVHYCLQPDCTVGPHHTCTQAIQPVPQAALSNTPSPPWLTRSIADGTAQLVRHELKRLVPIGTILTAVCSNNMPVGACCLQAATGPLDDPPDLQLCGSTHSLNTPARPTHVSMSSKPRSSCATSFSKEVCVTSVRPMSFLRKFCTHQSRGGSSTTSSRQA